MKVHPAAELFPLMGEQELQDLAEDIKTNGLRQPLLKTEDDQLIDGRNRLAACEIAGVQPEFITANGSDPFTLVVSLNVKRRNLTASQRAIAAAEAYGLELGPEVGPKEKWYRVYAKHFGANHEYVQQARALVERDAPGAAAVKRGAPLAEHYKALVDRERTTRLEEADRETIRAASPELAERVDREELTLKEAKELLAAEQREERERRARLVGYINEALEHLSGDAERAAWMADELRDREEMTSERWASVSEFTLAVARLLEEE